MIPLVNYHELLGDYMPKVDSLSKIDIRLVSSFAAVSKRILEIGTKHGRTTINLARFSPKDAEIVTIDKDQSQDQSALLNYPHACKKIKFIQADTSKFNFSDSRGIMGIKLGTFDLIFIDGCHDYPVAVKDAYNAIQIINEYGVIIWHDYCDEYGNPGAAAKAADLFDLPIQPLGESLGIVNFGENENLVAIARQSMLLYLGVVGSQDIIADGTKGMVRG